MSVQHMFNKLLFIPAGVRMKQLIASVLLIAPAFALVPTAQAQTTTKPAATKAATTTKKAKNTTTKNSLKLGVLLLLISQILFILRCFSP